MAKLGIIYATDALLQNVANIVSLRLLIFDILNYKPLTMLNYVRQFFEIMVVFTRFLSETKSVTSTFFCISDTSNSSSDSSKKIKEIYRVENFARTSLSHFSKCQIALKLNKA